MSFYRDALGAEAFGHVIEDGERRLYAPAGKGGIYLGHCLKLDEDALLADTFPTLHEQMIREIAGRLTKGETVTLELGGKPLVTYFPCGKVERHNHVAD